MPGEGGVGKLRTIQAISDNFEQKKIAHILVKSAFTGIAATLIDRKTIHTIVQLPVTSRPRSPKATRILTKFWCDKRYLVIDEMSMVPCHMLSCISVALSTAKSLAGMEGSEEVFGGVNVILVGDFHQFPPVTG